MTHIFSRRLFSANQKNTVLYRQTKISLIFDLACLKMKLRSGTLVNTGRISTGTKRDAITELVSEGDPSKVFEGAKNVTVIYMNNAISIPGYGRPKMLKLEVDWGERGEEGYKGMHPRQALTFLRKLNPGMDFAISRQSLQYSVSNSRRFLRILTDINGKVVSFSRR